jgi:hypothetical protein
MKNYTALRPSDANVVQLDYYVMALTCAKAGKWRGNRTEQCVGPLRATPVQKPAAGSEMNDLVLISAVR